MESYREALERAAARFGIELAYTDTWGRTHQASDETLRLALDALGIPAATPEEIAAALDRHTLEEWARPFPSAIVLAEGADHLRLNIAAERAGSSVKLEFEWEGGELEHHWFWLPELADAERATIRGKEFIAKRVPLPALRLGYHRLRVHWVKEPEQVTFAESRLIVAPRRARTLEKRIAGVAVALYGVRSARNWGCGDATDLHSLIDTFAPAGAQFIALNPLHAIANRQPYNTSPYLPECSLYRNFLYIDVERVPGFQPEDAVHDGIKALRDSEFVEYEAVAKIKLEALRKSFERCQASGHTGAFHEYAAEQGSNLENFATYSALYEDIHARNPETWLWTDWPEPFRDPCSPEVRAWAAAHRTEIDFYKFLQWQIDRQLAEAQTHAIQEGMSIGLYHDLALATDRYGADLWANGRFFRTGARVGAPPDELAPGGQDWGFPPPNRDAHRADGYELFAQSIRNNARHGGALRIDHVMRFFRLFWIPDELTAADGLYVRDYDNELLSVLALESHRNNFLVIGEDLGTVAPEIRWRLGEMGILGYRLMWFEKHHDGRFRAPHEYSHNAAVTTTTHDLPTLAGFKHGRDIEARKAAGLVDDSGYCAQWNARHNELARLEQALAEAGFSNDPLGFLLSTPCVLAIVNQEDLTGETEQQNLPASTWQYPNWRRKMRVPVEDLAPIADTLRTHLQRSARHMSSLNTAT